MPKNVGRYQQGNIKTQPDFGDHSGGDKMPSRTAPAPAPPKNKVMGYDNGNTVANNDGHEPRP